MSVPLTCGQLTGICEPCVKGESAVIGTTADTPRGNMRAVSTQSTEGLTAQDLVVRTCLLPRAQSVARDLPVMASRAPSLCTRPAYSRRVRSSVKGTTLDMRRGNMRLPRVRSIYAREGRLGLRQILNRFRTFRTRPYPTARQKPDRSCQRRFGRALFSLRSLFNRSEHQPPGGRSAAVNAVRS